MRTAVAFLLLAPLLLAQGRNAELAERLQQRKIARFFERVEADPALDAETRTALSELRATDRLGGEYGCIHQALLLLHPDYRRADALLLGDRFAAAAEAFEALRESDDEYLRAYAAFRYGLAEMNRERYEQAVQAFTTVLNDFGRYVGCDIEAAFYRAVCLGQIREKEEAIVAAKRFLEDYPDAPERYKKAMEQMKNELLQEWESPLYDLAGRMKHVARKIDGGDTGKKTQDEQKEIVRIIEELIQRAEEQEGQGQGGGRGGGAPRGNRPPTNPADRSAAPPGASRVGDLRPRPKPKAGDTWGAMRDKEREEVLQSLKEKIPGRYRELQKQYDKALAEGKRVTEPAEDAGEGK